MKNATNAAHLFTAAGATWPAVDEVWHRGAVTGGFGRAMAVHEQYAAVMRRGTEHDLSCRLIVSREDRTDERAAAPLRQLHRVADRAIRHHGVYRAERFDVVGR